MNAPRCPSPEKLAAYALGMLSEDALRSVADHATDCPHCQAQLQAADRVEDDLIAQIRQAPPADPHTSEPELSRLLQSSGSLSASTEAGTDATDPEGELAEILAPAQGPDEIGRLGPYRVLRLLGAGGMGLVLQAEDPQLHRLVALKVMKPAIALDATARERFLREARATAALRNDHIVTIYQVGQDRDVPYLAMELLQGESLDDHLGRSSLPLAEVLRIGREMAEGLAVAHEHGLIHRDIKPANIWLDKEQGRVKLLDFGLARIGTEAALTQAGHVLGTPAYMSPEQAKGLTIDARSDLFSVGCVLYRLCTNVAPFQRETPFNSMVAVATETPPSVRTLNPQVPAALAERVDGLLAKDPAARPATARTVAEALRKLERPALPQLAPRDEGLATVAVVPVDMTAVSVAPPRVAPVRPVARRRLAVAAVGVLLGVGLAACALAVLHLGRGSSHAAATESVAQATETRTIRTGLDTRPEAVPPGPVNDAFLQWVARLPHAERYSVAAKKLEERNPQFHGVITTNPGIKRIAFVSDGVTDLSPLRALPDLQTLLCNGSAPGKGTLTDLSPIKGLKLTRLVCHHNRIQDLAPLKDMPLETLLCDFQRERDSAVLKSIPTLRRINEKPIKQFWLAPVATPTGKS